MAMTAMQQYMADVEGGEVKPTAYYIAKEKRQIIEAFEHWIKHGGALVTGDDYYNKKFNPLFPTVIPPY